MQQLPYKIIGSWAAIMWGAYFLNLVLLNNLNSFGIKPREAFGLIGIVTSPFLHGSFFHIIGNTIPFLVMALLIATFYKNDFIDILVGITLLSGFSTWLLGATNSNHIGASGVVFGLAGFMIGAGFLTKKFIPMGIAMAVIFCYGLPLIAGLVPLRSGVSYIGHWAGLFSGVGMSYLYKLTNTTNS